MFRPCSARRTTRRRFDSDVDGLAIHAACVGHRMASRQRPRRPASRRTPSGHGVAFRRPPRRRVSAGGAADYESRLKLVIGPEGCRDELDLLAEAAVNGGVLGTRRHRTAPRLLPPVRERDQPFRRDPDRAMYDLFRVRTLRPLDTDRTAVTACRAGRRSSTSRAHPGHNAVANARPGRGAAGIHYGLRGSGVIVPAAGDFTREGRRLAARRPRNIRFVIIRRRHVPCGWSWNFPEEQLRRLADVCRREGVSRAEIRRRAVADYLSARYVRDGDDVFRHLARPQPGWPAVRAPPPARMAVTCARSSIRTS